MTSNTQNQTTYKPTSIYRFLHIRRINNGIHSNHNPELVKFVEYQEHREAIVMTVRLLFSKNLADDLYTAGRCVTLEYNTDLYIVGFVNTPPRYTIKTTDTRLNEFMEMLTSSCV